MVPYKTTQNSWVHYILFPLMIILILFTNQFQPWLLGLLGGFTVILFLFHSLILEIDQKELRIKFGPGFIKKKISMDQIEDCKPVQNSKWYSFGIRISPDFILYNVTGVDAVELTLKNKKRKVRIGTDKPEEVCKVVREVKYN